MSENATATVEGPAEELRAWLATHPVSSVEPVDVTVRRDLDSSDQDAWFYEIVLVDPTGGADTWDVDDLNLFQRQARDKALELGLAWPWYLRFRPVTDEEPEEPENEPTR